MEIVSGFALLSCPACCESYGASQLHNPGARGLPLHCNGKLSLPCRVQGIAIFITHRYQGEERSRFISKGTNVKNRLYWRSYRRDQRAVQKRPAMAQRAVHKRLRWRSGWLRRRLINELALGIGCILAAARGVHIASAIGVGIAAISKRRSNTSSGV